MRSEGIVPVMEVNGNNGNGMFGNNGDWAWIIILFLIFGWGGNNGFGGFGGGNGMYYTDATIQRGFDNQSVMNKLNGLENGLCDGFYAQNTNMLNGFNGVQQTLCQGFSGVTNAVTQNGYETRLATQNLSSQLASCCCDLSHQLSDCCCGLEKTLLENRYIDAQNICGLQNTINNTTRDIIDNNNCNTRAILDFLTTDKISTLTAENQALKFQASQTAQNAFITANQDAQTAEIIRRLGADCPVPSFVVQPPTPVTFPTNSCGQFVGYNSGCGCNGTIL